MRSPSTRSRSEHTPSGNPDPGRLPDALPPSLPLHRMGEEPPSRRPDNCHGLAMEAFASGWALPPSADGTPSTHTSKPHTRILCWRQTSRATHPSLTLGLHTTDKARGYRALWRRADSSSWHQRPAGIMRYHWRQHRLQVGCVESRQGDSSWWSHSVGSYPAPMARRALQLALSLATLQQEGLIHRHDPGQPIWRQAPGHQKTVTPPMGRAGRKAAALRRQLQSQGFRP